MPPPTLVVPMRTRVRAICCCLWFGLLPWWVYERESHYAPHGYWWHARFNLRRAGLWLWGEPDAADLRFERINNTRPNWTRWHAKGARCRPR